MKYLLILAFLFSGYAEAKMASYLKDGTVFVAIKNGRIYQFDSNNWKVSKRYKDGPDLGKEVTKAEVLAFFGELEGTKPIVDTVYVDVEKEVKIIERKPKRHFIIGHVGGANEKYVVREEPRTVILKEEYEIAFGLTYGYNFDNDWSFGATLINRTGSLNIGYSFD